MKQLFFIASLLNFFLCTAQSTSVPDSNFENYLEQNGMGDGVPNNGLVLTANIENVLGLIIDYKDIQDLTGIQDFTQLRILNCAGNNIPLVDVSQNMNLEFLNCQASNVDQLLLPPTASLENLRCPENSLTSLDISQNPSLFQLECQFNNLTALDITNNPILEIVEASFNNISGVFDTSQNPGINSLAISHNGISDIDLSQNPLLMGFSANDNSLETLDVRNGNNENIGNFNASGTHGILKCILVDDASATYLDNWLKDFETTFVNNQQECDVLGLADTKIQHFTVYPNPATSTVNINLPNQGFKGLVVTVANNLGQVLESKELLENTTSIPLDISGYPAGVYFVTLKAGNDITTKKLVVK